MRDDNKELGGPDLLINVQEGSAVSSSATDVSAKNTSTSKTNPKQSLPDGYVAIARIVAPSTLNGTTPIQFDSDLTAPLVIVDALSMTAFSDADVGKRVACVRIGHTQQLMIMGLLYTGDIESNESLLDSVISGSKTGTPESDYAALQTHSIPANDCQPENDIQVFDKPLPQVAAGLVPDPYYTAVPVGEEGAVPRQITLTAHDNITLQCGASQLTLQSDGRIKINGTYIHSRATKVQRLSGGSIKLN